MKMLRGFSAVIDVGTGVVGVGVVAGKGCALVLDACVVVK